jgi:integrase
MLGFASEDYICAMCLAYYAGLRIHECCKIDTATAESALKSGLLTVKGKNGKIRTVPVNDLIAITFQKQLKITERGQKLLVPPEIPTHVYIKRLQYFINRNRKKLPERDGKERLTFHGLRHAFAARKFNELIDSGCTERQAKEAVSKLLGHERGDVTEIYLSSLRKGKTEDNYAD